MTLMMADDIIEEDIERLANAEAGSASLAAAAFGGDDNNPQPLTGEDVRSTTTTTMSGRRSVKAAASAPAPAASRIEEAISVQKEDKDDDNYAASHNDHARRRLEVINNDDAAPSPLPTPLIAVSCQAFDIDGSTNKLSHEVGKDNGAAFFKRPNKKLELMEGGADEIAPPVPVGQLAVSLEALDAEDESVTKSSYLIKRKDGENTMLHPRLERFEGDNENTPPVPIAQLAASLDAIENDEKPLLRKNEFFLPEHTEATNQDQTMRPPPTISSDTRQVDSFSHVTPSHPPISRLPADPAVSSVYLPTPFSVLEATLVDDVVYDAIPFEVDNDQVRDKFHPVSCWTRRRILYTLLGLASVTIAVAVGKYTYDKIKKSSGKDTNPTAASLIWKPRGQRLVGRLVAQDNFRSSVSLSANGSILAIGNDADVDSPCYVRLYYWPSEGSRWDKIGDDIINDRIDRRLGCAVAVSGDGKTLAVGSEENDNSPGHVTLYSIHTSGWRRLNIISGEALADSFGFSVSLSDDGRTLAVGATRNSENGFSSGHVRLFQLDNSGPEWTQLGNDIGGESENDFSGWSVSLSGDGRVVAIGSPFHKNFLGQVRVYYWKDDSDGSRWEKSGKDLVGDQPGDNFGVSVSISGDGKIVAVGSPASGGDYRKGYARVYYMVDDNWQTKGSDLSGSLSGGAFGKRVFLSGDGSALAVSDPFLNTKSDMNAGCVRIYRFNDSTLSWVQRGSEINGRLNDFLGIGLSLSANGEVVATGSPYGSVAKGGYVRVFGIENF